MPVVDGAVYTCSEIARCAPAGSRALHDPDINILRLCSLHRPIGCEKKLAAIGCECGFAIIVLTGEFGNFGRTPAAVPKMRNDNSAEAEIEVVLGEVDCFTVRCKSEIVVQVLVEIIPSPKIRASLRGFCIA